MAPERNESIDAIPGNLGFTETPILRDLHAEIEKATTSDALRAAEERYCELAEKMVSLKSGRDYKNAQIGLIV
jgi:hypothetical protein